MQNRTRLSALGLAGLPAAALVFALGCSGHKSTPPPIPLSSNAFLSALTVQGANGDIAPAFAQGTFAYTLKTNYAANPTPVTVKATLADATATMTVNGAALASNTPSAAIPMVVGSNTITVAVKAQDGKTTQTYTIACTINAQNTTVHVLDSTNGVPLKGTTLTVADAAGNVLQTGIPVGANGTTTLGLDGVSKYNLSAQAPGSAQSMFQGFDSTRETVANFYCHPLGMINFPAQAPQITALATSADGVTWNALSGNSLSDVLANMAALRVTAQGGCNIAATAWSGFGMGLNVDQPAWAWNNNGPYWVEEVGTPVTSGSTTLYQSTMDLAIPLSNYAANTKHYVDLVVYDVANNRTEQKIYLNVTDGAADTTQADLSALTPSKVTVQLITHGLTRSIFATTPTDAPPTTYEPDIFFSLLNGSNVAQKITGYEVYRSTSGTLWTKVATQLFEAPTTASSLVYTDNDPTLQLGTTYYYKVRGFNGNTTNNGGYSQYSMPIASTFLPAFTAQLAAPATETISSSLAPKFTFSITNPALFDPAVSDYFYFTLSVTEKTGTAASYAMYCRYNFAAGRFETRPTSSSSTWSDASSILSIDATHANITIQAPMGYFQPGVSYQWTIFGTSTANACQFRKYTYPYNDPTSTSYGVAIAMGSTYEHSYGAVNGYFTLTIDPNAQ
ncbi:hypothetical protein GETHLI_13960 [Geothrix limicola]|uniref:Cadherin-like beta-sandwich-like domain-containing protein n=1 Tax=Geothrix limicola TaxID=2927978 RepID=A0ABQ5QDH2_9BACT|nr:cadherin-like beta sandwich domain-containing protein [Geothrix limicola]GLH72894.1 hypothetical protein GETHLI_13960 [Geothrix limicola]